MPPVLVFAMEFGVRVLIASRAPQLVASLIHEIESTKGAFLFAGAIDPDLGGALQSWTRASDVLLIDDESFLRIWKRFGHNPPTWLMQGRLVVLAESGQIVEVAHLMRRQFHLIALPILDRLGLLMQLALLGYVVLPAAVVETLRISGDRLQTVRSMPMEERRVLAHLGTASSAADIETAMDIHQGRVKALTQSVIRKLHLSNRTAVAVFVTTHPSTTTAAPLSLI